MAFWKKVEQPVGASDDEEARDRSGETAAEPAEVPADPAGAGPAAAEEPTTTAPPPAAVDAGAAAPDEADSVPRRRSELSPGVYAAQQASSSRYAKSGRRRGAHRLAAPLGFLVLVLAVVGVVSLVVAGIDAYNKSQDYSDLKEELYYFILPVVEQNPNPIDDTATAQDSKQLMAAVTYLTNKDQIQMQQNNSEQSQYAADEFSRYLISAAEIDVAYRYLFGPDASYKHVPVGNEDEMFEFYYDAEAKMYHVPLQSHETLYQSFINSIKKKGDNYILTVGYVYKSMTVDTYGRPVAPTEEDAEFFQTFTVCRRDGDEGGWTLLSITDESGATRPPTTTESALAAETSGATQSAPSETGGSGESTQTAGETEEDD